MCGRRWVSAQPPASVAGRPSRTVASESSRPRVERSTTASTPERANCEMKFTDSNALSRCIGLVSESALKTPTLASSAERRPPHPHAKRIDPPEHDDQRHDHHGASRHPPAQVGIDRQQKGHRIGVDQQDIEEVRAHDEHVLLELRGQQHDDEDDQRRRRSDHQAPEQQQPHAVQQQPGEEKDSARNQRVLGLQQHAECREMHQPQRAKAQATPFGGHDGEPMTTEKCKCGRHVTGAAPGFDTITAGDGTKCHHSVIIVAKQGRSTCWRLNFCHQGQVAAPIVVNRGKACGFSFPQRAGARALRSFFLLPLLRGERSAERRWCGTPHPWPALRFEPVPSAEGTAGP